MKPGPKVIPTAALLTGGIMVMASLQEKDGLPKTSELIGLMAVFTVLSAGRDMGIPIVNGMAVMALIVIALERGDAAFNFTLDQLDEKKDRKRKPRKRSGFKSEVI